MQVITITLSDEVYDRVSRMAARMRTDVATYTSALIADATSQMETRKTRRSKAVDSAPNNSNSFQPKGTGPAGNGQQSERKPTQEPITRSSRSGLSVRIHWEVINKGQTEDVTQRKAADTFRCVVERLVEVLGNDVLEQIANWECHRGPLVSKNPGQFSNKKTGELYSHHPIARTGYFLRTHSSTSEKSKILKDMLGALKLPKGLLEVRVSSKA